MGFRTSHYYGLCEVLDCFANSPLLDHRKCTENSGELINVDARDSRVIIFIKYTIFN